MRSDILKGIVSSSKKRQQTVERLDLGLQNNQNVPIDLLFFIILKFQIEDVLKLIEFLQPHNLKIGNIDAKVYLIF